MDDTHNKGDTINVTKASARKSILMQITRLKAANDIQRLTKDSFSVTAREDI